MMNSNSLRRQNKIDSTNLDKESVATTKIIFSSDPGTKNYAQAVVKASFSKGKMKVTPIFADMLKAPLDYVQGDIRPALKMFLKELEGIQRKVKVKAFDMEIMERFQTRNHRSGPAIEIISAMYGARAHLSLKRTPGAAFIAVMASQWKVAAKKMFDLDAWYETYCKPSTKRKPNPKYIGPPHVLDACLIGVYGAGKSFGLKNPFEALKSPKDQQQFLKQIKAVHHKGVKVRQSVR